MKAKKVIAISIATFIVLLLVAIAFDARTSALKEFNEIANLDQEIKRHEGKVIDQLAVLDISDSATVALLNSYRSAESSQERQRQFSALIAHTQAELVKRSDASDPLKRRVVDEFLGALNRRQVVERRYSDQVAQYNRSGDSWGKSLGGLPAIILP